MQTGMRKKGGSRSQEGLGGKREKKQREGGTESWRKEVGRRGGEGGDGEIGRASCRERV